jgi:hypothetical protein
MVKSLPLAHVNPIESGSQLRHSQRGESIQQESERRLIS